jgi:hypothetical protein
MLSPFDGNFNENEEKFSSWRTATGPDRLVAAGRPATQLQVGVVTEME